jgi:hypothetical protein
MSKNHTNQKGEKQTRGKKTQNQCRYFETAFFLNNQKDTYQ